MRALAIAIVLVLAACGDDDEHCAGGEVRDPGPAVDGASLAPNRLNEVRDDPGLRSVNASAYRVEASRVVLDGGVALERSDSFIAEGCDGGIEAARFGATFYLDAETGVVLRAACNGCA